METSQARHGGLRRRGAACVDNPRQSSTVRMAFSTAACACCLGGRWRLSPVFVAYYGYDESRLKRDALHLWKRLSEEVLRS